MKFMRTNLGFTLVELVATMVLIGIVSISAAPLLEDSGDAVALSAATKKIEADLRYAQNLATTTGETHGFKAINQMQYQVYKDINGVETVADSPFDRTPMSEDMSNSFPNISFAAAGYPAYTVEFDKTGKPVAGGGTTIVLTAPNGDSHQITVTANSGNITVQ